VDHPLNRSYRQHAEHFKDWAIEIPDLAYALAREVFLAGALTLLLRKAPQVADASVSQVKASMVCECRLTQR